VATAREPEKLRDGLVRDGWLWRTCACWCHVAVKRVMPDGSGPACVCVCAHASLSEHTRTHRLDRGQETQNPLRGKTVTARQESIPTTI
jgi:hypothetical protein